jgi:GcrA cell cycle regulator
LLIGIVKKNGIMLIDFALHAEREQGLSRGKCRWPISNPGAEDFCFCGNEPVKGLPYCLGHARIAYRSVGLRRSVGA